MNGCPERVEEESVGDFEDDIHSGENAQRAVIKGLVKSIELVELLCSKYMLV